MRVLGIDPGSRTIGAALLTVDDAPRFSEGAVLHLSGPLHARFRLMETHLDPFFSRADLVVAELPYMGGPSTTVHHVARALGYLEALAARRRLPFYGLPPTQIRAQFSSGRANKKDVARQLLWQIQGLPDDAPDHLYDAVAAAWAGVLLRPAPEDEEANCRVRVFSTEHIYTAR
ncbi:MAG: crossover junction endodeoxyribonuclease RuvC [Clostridiales bacterium]|nr:crossover junction endodeoxyribonuclease RuvC [Clostridiales bacterium]